MDGVPDTRYARHGDVSLAYQVVGDGPLNLLLVTGAQCPIDLLWDDPGASLKLFILPAVAGGLATGAGVLRLLRSQMLEVLRQDYCFVTPGLRDIGV